MNFNNLMEDAYASIYEKKKVSPAQQRANDNHYDGFEAAMASGATESQDDPECYTEYCKKNPIKKVKEEVELSEEGKKDACYHKVKSRYDVWPSAYASGALVKCRAKGADNWGNSSKKKTKKEEVEYDENYTSSYMEGYKELPADKMKKQEKGKSKDGDGPAQARKMEVVRKATQGSEGMVKDAVKGQEMSNKKKGLEKKFNAPSANKSNKNKAYELEGQRRRDLDKRYGPKKEELEAVFALLIGENLAIDEDSAINIITHMSDEWYDSLVENILEEKA